MRSFPALRLAAQLCFCAAVLCLFRPFRVNWLLFVALILLTLPAALLAAGCRHWAGRLALVLLPALALLQARNRLCAAAMVLILVYVAVYLALGRFQLETWRYRQEVLILLPLCAVAALLSALAGFRSPPARRLAAACVLLAISALRANRLGRNSSLGWDGGNLLLLLLPLAAGAIGGALIWFSVPLLRIPASFFGRILARLLIAWNGFWAWVMGYSTDIGSEMAEETDYIVTEDPSAVWDSEEALAPHGTQRLPELQLPWATLLAILAGLAILVLVIWLLRRGAKPNVLRHHQDPFVPEAEPETETLRHSRFRKRRSRRALKSNRQRIRSIYREYLVFLRQNGIRLSSSNTTAEITAASASVLKETDDILRSLYRRARYSGQEPEDQEVNAAQEALDRLTMKENLL